MKKMTGSFRFAIWDPWLIIFQIITIQSALYFTLGLLLALLGSVVGDTRTLDHIFEYHELQVRDYGGRMVIAAFIFNSFIGACVLWHVVRRTKLCMDFSCTWHLIHLFVCWFYNGNFPMSVSWWLLNVACATIMCICGEFLCLKTELKAIPLSLGPRTDL